MPLGGILGGAGFPQTWNLIPIRSRTLIDRPVLKNNLEGGKFLVHHVRVTKYFSRAVTCHGPRADIFLQAQGTERKNAADASSGNYVLKMKYLPVVGVLLAVLVGGIVVVDQLQSRKPTERKFFPDFSRVGLF